MNTETRCEKCKYFAALVEPYHYKKDGYPDGVTVYGFCAKDAERRFIFYPVYLPDGGACREFKRRTKEEVKA